MDTNGVRFDKVGTTTWRIIFPGEIQKGNGAPWHVGTEGHERVRRELEDILQNDDELSRRIYAKATTVGTNVITMMTHERDTDFMPIFSHTLSIIRKF